MPDIRWITYVGDVKRTFNSVNIHKAARPAGISGHEAWGDQTAGVTAFDLPVMSPQKYSMHQEPNMFRFKDVIMFCFT